MPGWIGQGSGDAESSGSRGGIDVFARKCDSVQGVQRTEPTLRESARARSAHIVLIAAMSLALVGLGPTAAFAQAPPGAQGPPPPATPQGCHGFQTVLYKQLTGNPSQALGIVPQTRSEAGRGGTLQAFLAAFCGIGSQAR